MAYPPWSSNGIHHTYHPCPTAIERPIYPLGNLAYQKTHPCSPAAYVAVRKSWDQPRVEQLYLSLLSNCDNDVSRAHLLTAASKHSGAWLNAPSVSSLGLQMCNENIRIAVGLRWELPLSSSRLQISWQGADQLGHHGLLCRYSQGRLARHSIIHHSLAAAKIHSCLEPSGLHC